MGHDGAMAALTYDEVLAGRLRAARAEAGLDQAVIVERMRALGYATWHRQTMGKIERGERRLLVGEVMALAWVLGVTLLELMKPAESAGLVAFPSGELIAAHSIAASLGAYNDGAVTWSGTTPRVTVTELDQSIQILRYPRFLPAPGKS